MSPPVGYSPLVRKLFAEAPGAGDLSGPREGRLRGEAGAPEQGAWVAFEARIADGRISEAVFRAWGCPHVIAAAALVAARIAGRPPAEAARFDVQALAQELDLPPAKLGRLLVVQDAAAALAPFPAGAR